MRRHLGLCGPLVLIFVSVAGIAEETTTTARQESQVAINAEYDTFSESEGYGFVLIVNKWEPRETAEVNMVGPQGEVLTIVSRTRSLRANEKGRFTVFVPYGLRGLYAGHWQLIIAGKNGIHQAGIEVPAVPERAQSQGDGT
jgi:hypothetical protein